MKILCPECKKIISSTAKQCPRCGWNNNLNDNELKILNRKYLDNSTFWGIICFIFIVVGIIFIASNLENIVDFFKSFSLHHIVIKY